MRLVNLLIILSISLVSCISDGLKEPVIEFCTIIDGAVASCTTPNDPAKDRDLTTVDMIGYQCVSSMHFADAETHHDILHREINKKANKK